MGPTRSLCAKPHRRGLLKHRSVILFYYNLHLLYFHKFLFFFSIWPLVAPVFRVNYVTFEVNLYRFVFFVYIVKRRSASFRHKNANTSHNHSHTQLHSQTTTNVNNKNNIQSASAHTIILGDTDYNYYLVIRSAQCIMYIYSFASCCILNIVLSGFFYIFIIYRHGRVMYKVQALRTSQSVHAWYV